MPGNDPTYLSYRELILNFEGSHLYRLMINTPGETDHLALFDATVAQARHTCSLCHHAYVKFVPFADPDYSKIHVVRVCQNCSHAEEL